MSAMTPFNTLHPSALRQSALPRWVSATPRARGALRYRCPKTGSFVLLTHPTELAKMAGPQAPVYCPGCGDTHLLTRDGV
jgi:hypothetical protein